MARLDRGPVSGAACGPDMPAIEVRSLSFAYPDADAAVLEGLDWSVPQGAFALLVGGTGSGKSTLLSLLKPEIAPAGERTGELLVLGRPVADMDVRASAERVGYVFQDPENQIVCETVWHEMAFGLENLGLARDEMRRRVAETSYFFGLEDWLHRDTDTLSGGRKQLLSLAAVLTLRPRALLLDEPTSQLDPVAEKNFLHALFRVNRELGCTVVVATHQPRPMLEYATCTYRIEGGQRQLLALAKLLLIGPELLLLDEPTKGLDLASRRIIARALRDHAKAGGTVIMATHDLDFAEQASDDVAMMFDGEIACVEPPADFFADNVFYRA